MIRRSGKLWASRSRLRGFGTSRVAALAVLLCAILLPADGFCPPGRARWRRTEPHLRMCSGGGRMHVLAEFSGPASRRQLFARLSSWAAACAVSAPRAVAAEGVSGDVLVVPLQDCGGRYAHMQRSKIIVPRMCRMHACTYLSLTPSFFLPLVSPRSRTRVVLPAIFDRRPRSISGRYVICVRRCAARGMRQRGAGGWVLGFMACWVEQCCMRRSD